MHSRLVEGFQRHCLPVPGMYHSQTLFPPQDARLRAQVGTPFSNTEHRTQDMTAWEPSNANQMTTFRHCRATRLTSDHCTPAGCRAAPGGSPPQGGPPGGRAAAGGALPRVPARHGQQRGARRGPALAHSRRAATRRGACPRGAPVRPGRAAAVGCGVRRGRPRGGRPWRWAHPPHAVCGSRALVPVPPQHCAGSHVLVPPSWMGGSGKTAL